MRIRREKVPGVRVKAVHFPGGDGRMAAWMGDGSACPARDLSSVAFEKCLITRRMQNGAEDRGTRKPSKCPESATPVLGLICIYS